MVGTRFAQIPFEHVVAEVAAAPFVMPESLAISATELRPELDGKTARLWRSTENSLLTSLAAYSVDELTSLRDWLWFNKSDGSMGFDLGDAVPLDEMLGRFADNTLIFGGNALHPRRPEWSEGWQGKSEKTEDPLARRYWRWITFSLPPDLLIAAHTSHGKFVSKVEIVSPVLKQMLLDKGYVEPHMHLGAALDFPLLWVSLLHRLGDVENLEWDDFSSPGAVMDEGKNLGYWLIHAAIVRYILAAFLHEVDLRKDQKNHVYLDDFLQKNCEGAFSYSAWEKEQTLNLDFQTEQEYVLKNRKLYFDPSTVELMRRCLNDFGMGTVTSEGEGVRFANLQSLYNKLTTREDFPDNIIEAMRSDPIFPFYPVTAQQQPSSEIQFMRRGLRYLRECRAENIKDDRFARLFWQVVRTRCLFYRHVVQRPLTPGLQWFLRFYGRLSTPRQPLSEQILTESAALICGKDLGLRSLEVRTAPEAKMHELHKKLKGIIQAFWNVHEDGKQTDENLNTKNESTFEEKTAQLTDNDTNVNNPCEYGIVLHFVKSRSKKVLGQGLPNANAMGNAEDPSKPSNYGHRYSEYYLEKRQEAIAIAELIKAYPCVLFYLRGIDVATDELGIPNWVLAPLMRYVKDVSRQACAYLAAKEKVIVPPFRTTAHSGEDYIHLLGGLRRVDETVDYFNMSQGDRLGHAISLGVNPTVWAEQTRGVAMTCIERLFDLAWEWKFTTLNKVEIQASRLQYVLNEIEKQSKAIFDIAVQPPVVVAFVDLLYTEQRQTKFYREPWDTSPGNKKLKPEQQLLKQYLIDPYTFAQGQKTILIDPSTEAEVLNKLQFKLRQKIGKLGITVEINPSSNLLIGNMADLKDHPLWRLNPPQHESDLPPISVCIGSDDPLTFATSTREEYQIVYDTLTLSGLTDAQARSWLEDAREAGLNSRFTFAHNRSPEFVWRPAYETKEIIDQFYEKIIQPPKGIEAPIMQEDWS